MSDPRGNFGILSSGCFTGSMYGQPPVVFAVLCYAISNARPHIDEELGEVGMVELNPKMLAGVFSVTHQEVQEAIDVLSSPDPESRSDLAEGRRLIRADQFRYVLVNMAKYRAQKEKEWQREYWREQKRKQADRKRGSQEVPGTSKEQTGNSLFPSSSTSASTSSSLPTAKRPDDVSEELFKEWLAFRRSKKWPVTQRVLNGNLKKGAENGLSASQTLEQWMADGYQGFFPRRAQTASQTLREQKAQRELQLQDPSKVDYTPDNEDGTSNWDV